MIYDILYESSPWHTRVALFDETGKLLNIHYDEELRQFVDGAHVLGRVRKVMQAMGAAFVDIGDTVDGFLPLRTLSEEGRNLVEGQEIMVRVAQPMSEDKGAKLDGRVLVNRPDEVEKAPMLIKGGPSALSRILQDAGQHPVRVWVVDERNRKHVAQLVQDEKIFQLNHHEDVDLLDMLDDQLVHLAGSTFQTPGGGNLEIELTKALTAIDVNSASFRGSDSNWQLELNTIAAHEVVRLVKLLDISGNIITDFVTMKSKKDRKALRSHLIDQFNEHDSRRVEVLEMSRFGLIEMNREKSGETLLSLLKTPVFVAGDICLKLLRQSQARKRIHVLASPDVADVLRQRFTTNVALVYVGCAVEVQDDASLPVDQYSISSK